MAKKIKFGLEMADGYPVRRDLEELREHFDPVKAIEHFASGKLSEWLSDRYYDDIAEQLDDLDKDAPGFQRQLCKILGVDPQKYVNEERDIDAITRTKEKETRLRQKTSDEIIIANAAITAFDRSDLVELWDDGAETIYLCGDAFDIPANVGNTKYIGILGTPKVTIKAKSPENLAEQGIEFENVELPEYLREKKVAETKPCPKCGQENPLSAKFCNGCGAAMENNRNDEKEIVAATAGAIEMADDATNPLTMEELRYIFIQNFPEFDDEKTWRLLQIEEGIIPKYYNCDFNDMQKKLALNLICKGKYSENDIIQIATSNDFTYGWAITKNSLCVVHKKDDWGGILGMKSWSYSGIIKYADVTHTHTELSGSSMTITYWQDGAKMQSTLSNTCFGKFDDYSNHPLHKLDKYLEAVRKFYPESSANND